MKFIFVGSLCLYFLENRMFFVDGFSKALNENKTCTIGYITEILDSRLDNLPINKNGTLFYNRWLGEIGNLLIDK